MAYYQQIVREPENNVYGPYKVLRRVDMKYVVHDTREWPPKGEVLGNENAARLRAQAKSSVAR